MFHEKKEKITVKIRSVFMILIGLVFSLKISAQSITITGKVIDAETGEGIPYVNVGVLESQRGTSTNEEGTFVLSLNSSSEGIIFSHLNYERRAVAVSSSSDITIELTPTSTALNAISVTGRKRKGFVEKLVFRAYNQAIVNGNKGAYGKALYRQKSTNDSLYSELFEIFYDMKSSSLGIDDWEIQEGRYAMNEGDLMVVNKNFTLLSRILTPIQPRTDDFVMPIRPEMIDYYDFSLKSIQKVNNRKVAIIDFVPFGELKIPAWKGEVYIDIDNYDILKLKGGFKDDRLNFVNLAKDGYWKNYQLNYEMSFRTGKDSVLSLDYVQMHQSFDYYEENKFEFPVETNSILTVFEQYEPSKSNKRLGGRIRYRKSDAKVLDQLGYRREFWEDNPVLKRTPVEEEVIASFESKKAFGTIYLNDQKQIILERSDLQKDPFIRELTVNFSKSSASQEKAYLHLDKPFYTAGEDIWYSAFLVDGATHFSAGLSDVLHVELTDNYKRVVSHQVLPVTNGRTQGDIHIPDSLQEGRYWIKAYSRWMRNMDNAFMFQKELPILNKKVPATSTRPKRDPNVIIKFFPEGGDLLAEVPTQVAFKAVDQFGKSKQVAGTIVDEKDKTVAQFESNFLGLGSFFLSPKSGSSYRAIIQFNSEEKSFDLPQPKSNGFAIQVNNTKENTIRVIVRSSEDHQEESFYLVGQSRGRIVHKSKGVITRRGALMDIAKAKIPDGIFQITLFDKKGLPRCERLVFVDSNRDLDVQVATDKQTYDSRETVNMKLSVYDPDGKPVKGDLSISVTDADQVNKSHVSEHISSYLLLSSDLKGFVENPGHYFKDRTQSTVRDLDKLLLTHGWRRFSWQQIQSEKPQIFDFAPEKGFMLMGLAVNPRTRKPLSNVNLNAMALTGSSSFRVLKTDENGVFEMTGLYFQDSSTVYFKVPGKKNQSKELKVSLRVPDAPTRIFPTTGNTMEDLLALQNIDAYLEKDRERRLIEQAGLDNVQILEGVTVSAYREEVDLSVDAVIVPGDRQYSDIFQMIVGQVPGVRVTGQGINTEIRIRTALAQPLIVLDDMPLFSNWGTSLRAGPGAVVGLSANVPTGLNGGSFSDVNRGGGIEALLSLSPDDIERIEVLKGASASIYGMVAENGVISIHTKKKATNNDVEDIDKLSYTDVAGFYSAREFYSPDHEVVLVSENPAPDKRATLYWNANVQTDENGEAIIRFSNSDDAKKFQIDIQGISEFGVPLYMLYELGGE